ncbi:MAG TPA: ABC transporter ATP-binding protein, partial [Candidatus Paceibacterota bacterium]|nr:ABC transporter ATP-binding protein [Candidatus Paceibacterota bacterium]
MLNDSNSTNIIELSGIGKTYENEKSSAIHDVNFSVSRGEFVTIIGASGCGKSTVLKIISGLEKKSEGTIKKPENISMDFQSGALFPWLSVFENVALGLRQQKFSDEHITREVDIYLRMMNIYEFKEKFPSDLSGGQRQRVGIARALAVNPAVLLLDEPFSALDAKTTEDLHKDIIEVWQKTGKTIVMVSHLISEAVALANRVILMKDGTVSEIFPITLP